MGASGPARRRRRRGGGRRAAQQAGAGAPAGELEPVKKLAFEDITALGMELQDLDEDLAGHELDAGTRADYQRALDAYEAAKFSGDAMTRPEDITQRHQDPRRRPLRHRVCPGARRRASRCRPGACLLLRPAPRAVRRGRALRPAGRCRARRACLRAGRRAGPGGRRARRTPGDGRLGAGAVLAGRPRLRAVRRWLLRLVRTDGLDVHGRHVRGGSTVSARGSGSWPAASATAWGPSARASADMFDGFDF